MSVENSKRTELFHFLEWNILWLWITIIICILIIIMKYNTNWTGHKSFSAELTRCHYRPTMTFYTRGLGWQVTREKGRVCVMLPHLRPVNNVYLRLVKAVLRGVSLKMQQTILLCTTNSPYARKLSNPHHQVLNLVTVSIIYCINIFKCAQCPGRIQSNCRWIICILIANLMQKLTWVSFSGMVHLTKLY